jgi:hypothetical protein
MSQKSPTSKAPIYQHGSGALFVAALIVLAIIGAVSVYAQNNAPTAWPGSATAFSGRALIRDITGTSSPLKSDRLVFEMSDAPLPPANRSVRCYMLNAAGKGQLCPTPLNITGSTVNVNVDWPGRNLVADFSAVRLMQESVLFSATLPVQALAHIRTAVSSAADTPGQVSYSAGLYTQAEIIAAHAGFAKEAADDDDLLAVRQHAEHVLNTLYGELDPRFGDHDNDSIATNPGDGYGLLRYSSKLKEVMQQVAAAPDATAAMIARAQDVQTTLNNIGLSDGSGTWAPLLIARASEVLSATTATAAQTPATQMLAIANRIFNGEDLDDDGEAEPIANEGGAKTARRYAQRTADYLPGSGGISGSVQHVDLGATPANDALRFVLSGLPVAAAEINLNESIYAYLLDANDAWMPIGPVTASGATIDATLPVTGIDVIASFDTLYVSVGVIYADGSVPEAALAPLRQALYKAPGTPATARDVNSSAEAALTISAPRVMPATDHSHHVAHGDAMIHAGAIQEVVLVPTDTDADGKGHAVGLLSQAQIIRQHAGFAQGSVSANSLSGAKQHVEHVLNTLYGAADPRYGDQDGDSIVTNPGDGYGLLAYRTGLRTLMQTLQTDANATQAMKDRAAEVIVTLDNIGDSNDDKWAELFIARAQEVLNAASVTQAQTPANQMVAMAERILNGEDLNDNGKVEPLPNEGGSQTAYVTTQSALDMALTLRFTPDTGGGNPTATPTNQPGNGDAFENDDTCQNASTINPTGAIQNHTFHKEGDVDWVKFTAKAQKTYIVELNNLGAKADGTITLHNACGTDPDATANNAFGSVVTLEWDSTKNGDYFLELRQFDPSIFGSDANYRLIVTEDNTPPTPPGDLRCIASSQTAVGLQWKRNTERDVVKYRVTFRNENATDSGNRDINDPEATFMELTNLTPNELYFLNLVAVDYSNNISPPSGEIPCRAATPNDATPPSVTVQQPTASSVFSTTASIVTISGVAQDATSNLSRVRVRNLTNGAEGTDFTLSGASDDFRVKDLALQAGDNTFQVTVIDEAGNSSQKTLTVKRQGSSGGAALIVAGHNETFGLQTNIYNAANRAYRLFQTAGFSKDNIFYISPTGQDADGDGSNDVNAAANPTAVINAITGWAAQNGRTGPGKPFHVYMIDHGFEEKFCVSGCNSGPLTPKQLDDALRSLETATGVTEVNVIIEACQSGSFIDRFQSDIENTLVKQGRVIITSTGRENNAYASAEGAFFSDAFFSCMADSGSLKGCFDEATTAVGATKVDQTPWLDDNGDAQFTDADGSVAQGRTFTKFFASTRPVIASATLDRQGTSGVISAVVQEGLDEIDLVWAAVFPPSFQEPSDVTINLNAPIVRLEQSPDDSTRYSFNYTGGFSEDGEYRVIVYAQDTGGIHAAPKTVGDVNGIYLPIIVNK